MFLLKYHEAISRLAASKFLGFSWAVLYYGLVNLSMTDQYPFSQNISDIMHIRIIPITTSYSVKEKGIGYEFKCCGVQAFPKMSAYFGDIFMYVH